MHPGVNARGCRPLLDGFSLKCIAVLCMTLDHVAAVFLLYGTPLYMLLRTIGRLAFPIYCFLIAEGDVHTRSRGRYAARLWAFALLSEIPFDLAFQGSLADPESQNVFFTLGIGELVLWGFARIREEEERRRPGQGERSGIPGGFTVPGAVAALLVLLAGMGAADALSTDYGQSGVLLIALFSVSRGTGMTGLLVDAALMAFCWWGGTLQLYALLAFVLLLPLYNGERGIRTGKYAFYLYYPLHLLLLTGLAALLR